MSRLQACRVCLAHDSRMYSIVNGPLQEIYENITEIPLVMGDIWPTCVCYICYRMIRKFQKFIDKSLKANDLLLLLISSESEITTDTLNMIVKHQPDISWKFSVSPMESIMPLERIMLLEEVKLEPTFNIEIVKSESDVEEMQDQNETGAKLHKKLTLTNKMDKDNQPKPPTTSTTTEGNTPIEKEVQIDNPNRIIEFQNEENLSKPYIFFKYNNENDNVVEDKPNNVTNHKETLICDVCNSIFYCKRNLEIHIRESHTEISAIAYQNCTIKSENCNYNYSENKSESNIGSLTTSNRGHLINERDIHKGDKPYKCNVCDKRFVLIGSLFTHQRIHTGEKPYKCNVCDKRFNVSSNLHTHKKIHTGEKPYKCNVCGKRFTQTGHLSTHQRIHTGDKPYKCHVCDKRFTVRSNLHTHQKIHTGEKPYKCNVCDKRFTRTGNLSTHQRIHTGEKPHKCKVCDKRFTQISSLSSHQRIHKGEKPHKCIDGDKKNTVSSDLSIHQIIHTREKPYKCNVCDKGFRQISHLSSHQRIHTEEKPHKCT